MYSLEELIATYLLFGFFILILLVGAYFTYLTFNKKYKKRTTAYKTEIESINNLNETRRRNLIDFFWSDASRFSWISLIFSFFIALGFALGYRIPSYLPSIVSIILLIIFVFFLMFAWKSYQGFEEKAKARLTAWEKQIKIAIEKEVSFEGDKIQSFTFEDKDFDTDPKIFDFPDKVTKITFPPFEKNAAKQPIISTRKLDFLILSREYFSVCKGAAMFNLLNPEHGDKIKKKSAEVPPSEGDCDEYYYSQIQNVKYDADNECIRIIYNNDTGHEDVTFSCKKAAANRKPAMKALKEKLRLTERQKLRKIDEHENYEKILNRRKDNVKEDNNEKN